MKKPIAAAFALALAVVIAAPSAQAQSIQIGPGGISVQPDRGDPRYRGNDRRGHNDRRFDRISSRDATRIARANGMANVNDVSERRGSWTVRGTDRRKRGLIIRIDGRTGNIIDVNRERGRF